MESPVGRYPGGIAPHGSVPMPDPLPSPSAPVLDRRGQPGRRLRGPVHHAGKPAARPFGAGLG
ncbi:MAG: hypothetical protein WKG07_14805 [Hymenobacter sp.]